MPDESCPFYEWRYKDVMKSNVGFPGCKARLEEWNNDLARLDYPECNSANYKQCEFFMEKISLESRIE